MNKHETVPAVWAAIRATHKDLVVFGSYSAPDGDEFGDPNTCIMYTEYGFKSDNSPIIAAETCWIKGDKEGTEVHTYWLCVTDSEVN